MTAEKKEVSLEDVLAKVTALEETTVALTAENERLKNFAEKTIQEKKEKADKDKAEIDKLAREKEEAKTHTKEEAAALIQQYKDKATALEQQLTDYAKKEHQNKITAEASKLAAQLTKDGASQKILTKEFKERIQLDEDGKVTVLDEQGKPTISTVEQLVKNIKDSYPRLVDGLDSTGGGAHSSGGAEYKKLSEMSEGEKVALYTTDIIKYRELEKLE